MIVKPGGPTINQNLLRVPRHRGRTLGQNPVFTAVTVLSLALGIGANTAIFSLIHPLLLKTLPVEDPGRLVMVSDPNAAGRSIGTQTTGRNLFTSAQLDRIRSHTPSSPRTFTS